MRISMLTLLALIACKGDEGDDTPTDDSTVTGDSGADDSGGGDDTDDTETEIPCDAKPKAITPLEDQEDVFYRDPLTVQFTVPVEADDAAFILTNAETGEAYAVETEWNASAEIATLTRAGGLAASVRHSLVIDVCGASYETFFTTSSYGTPLTIDPAELVTRTYVIEFGEVNFTEPVGIGGLLSLYIDVPILVGVTALDGVDMSLVGAQGRVSSDGEFFQLKKLDGEYIPTWDFTGVNFAEPPFFSADNAGITITYSGVSIPVWDFHLEGTFAADGSSFAGGKLWGLADTREMDALLDQDDPEYLCNFVAGVGAECEPCPDGETYCLFLRGEEIKAALVPDLVLVRQDATGPI